MAKRLKLLWPSRWPRLLWTAVCAVFVVFTGIITTVAIPLFSSVLQSEWALFKPKICAQFPDILFCPSPPEQPLPPKSNPPVPDENHSLNMGTVFLGTYKSNGWSNTRFKIASSRALQDIIGVEMTLIDSFKSLDVRDTPWPINTKTLFKITPSNEVRVRDLCWWMASEANAFYVWALIEVKPFQNASKRDDVSQAFDDFDCVKKVPLWRSAKML